MFVWACLPQILGVDRVVVVFFYRLKLLKLKKKQKQKKNNISHMKMCLEWISSLLLANML